MRFEQVVTQLLCVYSLSTRHNVFITKKVIHVYAHILNYKHGLMSF